MRYKKKPNFFSELYYHYISVFLKNGDRHYSSTLPKGKIFKNQMTDLCLII